MQSRLGGEYSSKEWEGFIWPYTLITYPRAKVRISHPQLSPVSGMRIYHERLLLHPAPLLVSINVSWRSLLKRDVANLLSMVIKLCSLLTHKVRVPNVRSLLLPPKKIDSGGNRLTETLEPVVALGSSYHNSSTHFKL